MKDKELTWDIVNSEKKCKRLFERYCWFNSCCKYCNKKVRFWCKVKERLIKHQEKIISKLLNKRNNHPTEKGVSKDCGTCLYFNEDSDNQPCCSCVDYSNWEEDTTNRERR